MYIPLHADCVISSDEVSKVAEALPQAISLVG